MTETMTINLAPADTVYSPHVRVMKAFVEQLTRHVHGGEYNEDEQQRLMQYVATQLPAIREAMSTILTDDFLLIVDGKRLPGRDREELDRHAKLPEPPLDWYEAGIDIDGVSLTGTVAVDNRKEDGYRLMFEIPALQRDFARRLLNSVSAEFEQHGEMPE